MTLYKDTMQCRKRTRAHPPNAGKFPAGRVYLIIDLPIWASKCAAKREAVKTATEKGETNSHGRPLAEKQCRIV